jgi:hypothetical protein
MIKYALRCEHGHEFESWFADSSAFEKQQKRGLLSCPACDSEKVERAIMAPNVSGARKKDRVPVSTMPEKAPVAMLSAQEKEIRAKLKELREHITKNADNVGAKFPEEARKMHYGESEPRSIYGEATADDARSLAEEGIEFHPLPVLPDDTN